MEIAVTVNGVLHRDEVEPDVLDVALEAAACAPEGVDVLSDLFASRDYRAHLARVFTRRAMAGGRAG